MIWVRFGICLKYVLGLLSELGGGRRGVPPQQNLKISKFCKFGWGIPGLEHIKSRGILCVLT